MHTYVHTYVHIEYIGMTQVELHRSYTWIFNCLGGWHPQSPSHCSGISCTYFLSLSLIKRKIKMGWEGKIKNIRSIS